MGLKELNKIGVIGLIRDDLANEIILLASTSKFVREPWKIIEYLRENDIYPNNLSDEAFDIIHSHIIRECYDERKVSCIKNISWLLEKAGSKRKVFVIELAEKMAFSQPSFKEINHEIIEEVIKKLPEEQQIKFAVEFVNHLFFSLRGYIPIDNLLDEDIRYLIRLAEKWNPKDQIFKTKVKQLEEKYGK